MGQRSGSKQEELELMGLLVLVRSNGLVLWGKILAQPLSALKVLRDDTGQARWLEVPLLE